MLPLMSTEALLCQNILGRGFLAFAGEQTGMEALLLGVRPITDG